MYRDALTVVSWAIRDALVESLAGSREDDARGVVVDGGDVECTQRVEGRSARGRERRRRGRRRGRRVRRRRGRAERRVERRLVRVLCDCKQRLRNQANHEAGGRFFVSRLPPDTISLADDDAVWAVTVLVLNSVHR